MLLKDHFRTKFDVCVKSAYPSIADSWQTSQHVGVGPAADIELGSRSERASRARIWRNNMGPAAAEAP
jgi:hypothetical protein